MEVLVVGGNGFVGRHLVQALRERGDRVRVLALAGEDASWMRDRRVTVHRGDVRDPGSLAAAFRGAQGVFNLAAMMDVWRPIGDYRAVNVDGAANVGKAALAANVRRLVHMSSSSVYGMGLGRPANERFPLRPFDDPYPVTKAEGDRTIQRMIAEQGLPAVIIRPDQIFGPGDRLHFGQMADRLRAGRSILVGPGDNAMPFVYVSDVIDALLLALDHPRATGEAFNITNDRPLTQLEFLSAIASEIGARAPRFRVPYRALYAAGFAAERLATAARSTRRPPITRLGVAFFGTDNRYDIRKARFQLGFVPRVSIREGVRLTAAWYRSEAGLPPAAVRSAARVGSEA